MANAVDALRELLAALEDYYAPGDSVYEAYANSRRIEDALDVAYEVLKALDASKDKV
jgi:hypothetical protein